MKDSNDKSKKILRQIAIRERWDELSLHMLHTSKGPTDLQTTVHQNSQANLGVDCVFTARSGVFTLGVLSSAGKTQLLLPGKR